jgi:RPM1-interacting protein 4
MQKQQKNGAHIPKFGNWDNDGNVPYTVYFDNARKGKGVGGKPMNPNDPVDNPEAFSSSYAAPSPMRSGSEHGRAAANLPPPSPPPAHRHERRPSDAPAPPPPMSPSPYGGASPYRGEAPRRAAGRAGGYSVEQSPSPSPLHPYSQSRAADNSVEASPYGLVANSTDRPNRARPAPRGNETVSICSAMDHGVPKLLLSCCVSYLGCCCDPLMAADERFGGAQVRRLGLQPGLGGRLHAHFQQGEGGEEHPGQGAGGV